MLTLEQRLKTENPNKKPKRLIQVHSHVEPKDSFTHLGMHWALILYRLNMLLQDILTLSDISKRNCCPETYLTFILQHWELKLGPNTCCASVLP